MATCLSNGWDTDNGASYLNHESTGNSDHLVHLHYFKIKQECIPVGCVLPAAVAIHGGGVRVSALVHAGIHTNSPGCGPGDTPLGVGLERHPLATHLNFPPGCEPEDPPGDLQGMLGYLQGMLGYHFEDLLQDMLGYHL